MRPPLKNLNLVDLLPPEGELKKEVFAVIKRAPPIIEDGRKGLNKGIYQSAASAVYRVYLRGPKE